MRVSNLENMEKIGSERASRDNMAVGGEKPLKSPNFAKNDVLQGDGEDKKRTLRQNRALHKYFSLLAEELNAAGYDFRKTLRQDIDVPWSGEMVKEYLWRPVQLAQLKKESTTDMTTKDIDKVFDTLNRHLGTRFGIHVPFPCEELDQQNIIIQNENNS